jgi:hypothetical protein
MIRVPFAALIGLAVACLLPAQQPGNDKDFATLQGRAVNEISGEPIHKGVVRLSVHGADPPRGIVGSTDAEGRFRFKHIAPGRYNLSAEKNGFVDTAYGLILSLQAGDDLKDITLKLEPEAAITGRVLDEDGDPVSGAEVTCWYRQNFLGEESVKACLPQASTNSTGEFRLDGLLSSRYFLSASKNDDSEPSSEEQLVDSHGDPVELRDALTYYPGALDLSDASPIDIVSGEERGGIEIRLQRSRTYRISGKVALEGSATAEYEVIADPSRGGRSQSAKLSANGLFKIRGLLPGPYKVLLVDPNKRTIGRAQVDVTDTDRADIVLKPYRPSQVRAHVVLEGQHQTSLAGIAFLRMNPLDITTNCALEDGICAFHNVEPGKYILDIRRSAHGYIKSVRSGSRMFSPRAIEVQEGDDLALDVVLSDTTGRIDGEVLAGTNEKQKDQSQQDWSSVEVTLVPIVGADELFDPPRTTDLDQYGHFSFPELQPGKYKLYAGQAIGMNRWSNPDFVREMQAKGTGVEVREKDAIRLQLEQISEEETARTLQKLGIR